MRALNSSLDVDRRMVREDIEASKVHARELARLGVFSDAELREVMDGLDRVLRGIETGEIALDPELEDIHMNVEVLLQRWTPAARKLHTARSRNDQVVTDFRLWCTRAAESLREAALDLAQTFLVLARRNRRVPIPEYTHTQRAQVTTLAHHLLAYSFMFLRDCDRFEAARGASARCALGSGACAGVAYPYDRDAVARALGMEPPIESSLDAVSDRDFAWDLLYACAACAGHLSRLGAEWVLWASSEFHFVAIPEAFSSGSSIMPQKRNPDSAELLRGLAPAVIADLAGLLNLASRLPLGYAKDLQGDKAPVMRSVQALVLALRVAGGMVAGTVFHRARMREAAADPGLYATDLADALVAQGVPFREAHEVVGRLMREVERHGVRALDRARAARVHPALGGLDLERLISAEASIERRESPGGPSAASMNRLIARVSREIRRRWRPAPRSRPIS